VGGKDVDGWDGGWVWAWVWNGGLPTGICLGPLEGAPGEPLATTLGGAPFREARG
jgi:hypothetical protein